jgi:predicted dehydrogenase
MTINIAIIGFGLIAPRHAQAIISHPSTTLIALVEPSPTGPETAAKFSTQLFTSVEALLASNKPDAAIVCTPNHTHVPITRDLLSAGVHVLVEKPISNDISAGRELVQYARQLEQSDGVKLLVGHHRRFNPYLLKTKDVLSSGSLGRIVAVNGLWTLFKPDEYFAPPTDWRRLKGFGGVILINLVHDVDLLQYLFGAIVRVHAEKVTPQRGPQHEADEGAALTLRFASGVVGTFLVCDATPSPYNFESGTGENVNIPQMLKQSEGSPSTGFYQIFGSDASLSVPDMTRWSYDGRPAKSWTQPLAVETFEVDSSTTPYDLQLAHFVHVIQGKAEPSCSGAAGLHALIVCDAIRKALHGNQTVDIDVDVDI